MRLRPPHTRQRRLNNEGTTIAVIYAITDSMTTTYVNPDMPTALRLAQFYHGTTGVRPSAPMVLDASLVRLALFVNRFLGVGLPRPKATTAHLNQIHQRISNVLAFKAPKRYDSVMKSTGVPHIERIAPLCKAFGLAERYAFGSSVEGGFDPETSDYDFLIRFAPCTPYEHADRIHAA